MKEPIMQKTILITGATDGIGLETAKMLATGGHTLLLHGRNPTKLENAESTVMALSDSSQIERYVADLSVIREAEALAATVTARHKNLDVLINNAGVYTVAEKITADGLDARFAVNTIAPYVLTRRLLPLLGTTGRVVNVSSAAQAPVDIGALAGQGRLSDSVAYAQSKLAITMWSAAMARRLRNDGPTIIAVNPGSMLGSKMVKNAYGVSGGDLQIGADILCRATLSDEFADASGKYFDNDAGQFAPPHPDALDTQKSDEIINAIEEILAATAQRA